MSDSRETCLEKMNQLFKSQQEDCYVDRQHQPVKELYGQLSDVSVMLDCILDSSFLGLELVIPYPSLQSFSSLLSVISHRCPQLERLSIFFKHISIWKSHAMSDIMKPSALPLRPLPCLMSLSLSDGHRDYRHSNTAPAPECGFIFGIVGKCFPALSKFRFDGFPLRKMDVLKLIVKEELADIIFAPSQDDEGWSEDSVLVSLRIPTDYLNTICFTLEDMYTDDVCCLCTPPGRCNGRERSAAPFAFALRHFTRLHSMDIEHYWTAGTIKQIYKAPTNETRQADFEQYCREAALRVGLKSASSTLMANGIDIFLYKKYV